jgi:hypothetical protein
MDLITKFFNIMKTGHAIFLTFKSHMLEYMGQNSQTLTLCTYNVFYSTILTMQNTYVIDLLKRTKSSNLWCFWLAANISNKHFLLPSLSLITARSNRTHFLESLSDLHNIYFTHLVFYNLGFLEEICQSNISGCSDVPSKSGKEFTRLATLLNIN